MVESGVSSLQEQSELLSWEQDVATACVIPADVIALKNAASFVPAVT